MGNEITDDEILDKMVENEKSHNIYEKLSFLREEFHALELKKTGWNDYSKYHYFELQDFLVPALSLLRKYRLIQTESFQNCEASMTLVNMDNPEEQIKFISPMGSAKLKACHEVQNIGAVHTYMRRYLFVLLLEIVEHDAIDSSEGVTTKSKEKEKATQAIMETIEAKLDACMTPNKAQAVSESLWKAYSYTEEQSKKFGMLARWAKKRTALPTPPSDVLTVLGGKIRDVNEVQHLDVLKKEVFSKWNFTHEQKEELLQMLDSRKNLLSDDVPF